MKILHVVSGLPTVEMPYYQPFIQIQIDSLIREGLDIEVLDIKGYNTPINYIKSIKLIKNLIKEKDINLIHAHYSYCGFTSVKATEQRIPIVLSLMGSDILGRPDENGKLTLRGIFDKSLSTSVAKKVNHIIVKSEEMKSSINLSVPISVIPNGVDFHKFKPIDQFEAREKLGFNPDDFIILFLGKQTIPRKNFTLARNAVEKFTSTSGNSNIKLVAPYGISQNDVVYYMNAANVLLLTSYWEGSPNVIKEAMACNLPIISTDVGDVRKIIVDAFSCFIVGFSEIAISDKLSVIYKNRKRSNGRDKISHLRDSVIAREIIGIYENTVDRKVYPSSLAAS